MASLNLIPKWRRERRKLLARRRAWTIAACAYAAILAIGYLGWRIAWRAETHDLAARLTLARRDIDEMTRGNARLRATIGATRRRLAVNEALLAQPDYSLALALVARLRGDEVVLNRCTLDAPSKGSESLPGDPSGPPHFNLHGFGRSQAAVSQFALRLERSGLFQNVSILKSNREAFLTGEAVAFRIECLVRTDAAEPGPADAPKPPAQGRPLASAADAPAGRNP
jgi:hypothetical protein